MVKLIKIVGSKLEHYKYSSSYCPSLFINS